MQDRYILGTVGVVCITVMETAAILTGTDGAYLSLCIGGIGAIIGAVAGVSVNLKKQP